MNFLKQSGRSGFLFLVVFLFSLFLLSPSYGLEATEDPQAEAQRNDEVIDTLTTQKVIVYRGDLVELEVYGMTRIAIVDPGVIEIVNADVEKILIVGNVEGETSVFIWDSKGKRKIEVQVISKDLDYAMLRIQRLLETSKITGIKLEKNELEGKIQLTGKILKEKKETFNKIIDKFSEQVLNMTTEDNKLIEIEVQVTELNTTLSKVMGVNWSTGAESSLNFQFSETLPTQDGSLADLFKLGSFARTSAILATVSLLISEGKARVLSKPNVVVTNGDSASFLVGGEIPITTTTTNLGNVSQNISYKSYGIDLTVSPTIKEDKIDITLTVAIRDIDASNSIGGNTAFTTRSADTKLLLQDGQTIVLAGLIKDSKGISSQGVPFLRKIPVLGLLFRKTTWTPNSEVEVVISLTPRILKGPNTESRSQKKTLASAQADKKETGLSGEEAMEEAMEEDEEKMSEASDNAESPEGEEVINQLQEVSRQVENVSPVIAQYVQAVQQKIAEAISFPYEAKEKGWEGTATLGLKILSDGKLNKVVLKQSSGKEIFDKDALNTAQIVAPFAPFPAEIDLEELDITIPVIYSQKVILEGENPPASAAGQSQDSDGNTAIPASEASEDDPNQAMNESK